MRTMVDFTAEKLIVLSKEKTPRGLNALKEIERRKAAGTWKDPVEDTPKATTKPKTRRRKKTVKSEVTTKSDTEETEQETAEGE